MKLLVLTESLRQCFNRCRREFSILSRFIKVRRIKRTEIKVPLTLPINKIYIYDILYMLARFVYTRARVHSYASEIEKSPSFLNGATCTSAGLFTDLLKIP